MKLKHILHPVPTTFHFLLLALIGLFVGSMSALSPLTAHAQGIITATPGATYLPTAEATLTVGSEPPQDQAPDNPVSFAWLEVLASLTVSFVALAGVAALVSALINLLKLTPLVNDANTGAWVAGLNLVAFLGVAALKIFRPEIGLQALNGYAAEAATLFVFVTGYLSQIGLSRLWHVQVLKPLALPGVSTSFSPPTP